MRVAGVVIGAPNPRALAAFYAWLLGWTVVDEAGPRPGAPPQDGWEQLRPPSGGPGVSLSFEFEAAYVPPVWPSVAGEQQTAIIYAGRTPRQFACYAVLARHWIDTHPAQTTQERVVLVYAWTEIGEGGAIIPSYGDGYAYADALRTVFGTPDAPPATPPYCSGSA